MGIKLEAAVQAIKEAGLSAQLKSTGPVTSTSIIKEQTPNPGDIVK
jgi:hypothetical protein